MKYEEKQEESNTGKEEDAKTRNKEEEEIR